MTRLGLSKSRIMAGLQCSKRLWLEVHRPELIEYGPAQERIFAQGHDVGRLARALHPGGILVGADMEDDEAPPQTVPGRRRGSLRDAQRETQALLAAHDDIVLYEATFSHQGVLVRADVLERRDGRCVVTEVKSSTSVKEQHVTDAAIQAWVVTSTGLPLHGVALATVDRDFIYPGHGDYDGLLCHTDVTQAVQQIVPTIPGIVYDCRQVLAGGMPQVPVGRHCRSPYECPFLPFCRGERAEPGEPPGPVTFHVDLLPRGGKLVEELQAEGYTDLRDVPEERFTNFDHLRVWRATVSGEPQVTPALAGILRTLPYPRFYLDFETISFAVPRWPGTRPWQQTPVQFSLHVEDAAKPPSTQANAPLTMGGQLEHYEFLDLSGEDPTRACAEALLDILEAQPGPLLTYGSFEQQRLTEMAAGCQDLAPRLLAVCERIVDLYPIIKTHYYHPAMRGSWSIKAVVPTVVPELDYGSLQGVHEGSEAQAAFEEAIAPATSPQRREELRSQLLAYCERDTLAMVRLVQALQSDTMQAAP